MDLRRYFGPREPMLDEILRTSLLEHRMPTIQVDDNAARVLQMLTALHRPAHVVEIGTLFGWSTLHLARGLPPGGRITSFEVDPAAAELARNNLRRAALADRVEVVVGDAVPALRALEPQSVDLVFIDGDKRAYLEYLKAAVPLLPPGGLLVADDALAEGDF
ncbi:MAG TPA: class I SAM-dependent methyltransferase, partial [Microthrixaceae bacterium]|nr:class I SAM-dependent methyltransferase [Microthrixaceae bacterium]